MSHIVYPSPIAVRECCWACKGTGWIFAGASPIRFRKCFMCNGARGAGDLRRPEEVKQTRMPGDGEKANQ